MVTVVYGPTHASGGFAISAVGGVFYEPVSQSGQFTLSTAIPVSITSNPFPDLVFAFDGQPVGSPYNAAVSPGMHTIDLPGTFSSGGKQYSFIAWSDGVVSLHRVIDVQAPVTLGVTYALIPPTCPCGGTYPNCTQCNQGIPTWEYVVAVIGIVGVIGAGAYLTRKKGRKK